jgi:hypothetical protein
MGMASPVVLSLRVGTDGIVDSAMRVRSSWWYEKIIDCVEVINSESNEGWKTEDEIWASIDV